MSLENDIAAIKRILEQDEEENIFKGATQDDLQARRAESLRRMEGQYKQFIEKMTTLMQQLGFTETEREFQEHGPSIDLKGTKDNLVLELNANLTGNWRTTERLEIIMYEVGKSRWQGHDLYLPFKTSIPTMIKKIQDHILPKFAGGEAGWAATYTPKAKYKRSCAICGKNIPTGTRHMRMATGQTVCADCVKKASAALETLGEGMWVIQLNGASLNEQVKL